MLIQKALKESNTKLTLLSLGDRNRQSMKEALTLISQAKDNEVGISSQFAAVFDSVHDYLEADVA